MLSALAAGSAVRAAQPAGAGAPAPAPGNAPATTVSGVTVVAAKPPPAAPIPDVVIRNYVRSHGATTPRVGQLARWKQDICPQTLGLPEAYNAFVTERVKTVAASVGAPTKMTGRCDTDILVIFTTQPQALLDSFRKEAPVLLGFHYPAQLRRIATFNHTIQAWYTTATTGSSAVVGVAGSSGGTILDDQDSNTPSGKPGSRISQGLQSEFVAVVIVADLNKVADMKIDSIADYVALLALSHAAAPPEGCEPIASITDLLAPACKTEPKPDALTEGDVAYLRALYSADLSGLLWAEQDSIADHMQKILTGK